VKIIAQDSGLFTDAFEQTVLFIVSDEQSYGDIYALRPENGEPVALITEAFAQYPVWSSTNQELAFVSGLPSGDDILILDAESLEITNLTQNRAYEIYPRWSPDGERIAFATDFTGDWEVFVINRDGSELANLSNSPDSDDGGGGLDWSPDGKYIVFTSNRNGRSGIYVMNDDGSHQRLLLSNDPPSLDTSPVWSPMSQQIAFTSHRAEGYGIFVVDDDGANLTYLPTPTENPGHLSWSPDGIYLAFEVFTDSMNSVEIYVIEFNEELNEMRLTDNDFYDGYPAWITVSILDSDLFPVSLTDLIPDLTSSNDDGAESD
jgi:TolB protein